MAQLDWKRGALMPVTTIIVAMACMAPARAEEAQSVGAKQIAGLFVQSCLQFAGDRDGLRGWARKIGLKSLPAAVQDRFLNGLPGVAFDASNKDGKFVLLSAEGGTCSAIAEKASEADVIADLESDMSAARITFRLTAEKGDAEEKALNHREYRASRGPLEWRLLISTVRGPSGGQAMLTANRN